MCIRDRKDATASNEGQGNESASQVAEVKDEDTMDVDASSTALSTAKPKASTSPATLALSLTAARSAALASHTERHLTSLVSQTVNLQLQKMELKLQQFAELENLLAAERREMERQRQRLFLDRLAFRKRVKETEEKFRRLGVNVPAATNGGGDGGERLEVKGVDGERVKDEFKPLTQESAGYKSVEI